MYPREKKLKRLNEPFWPCVSSLAPAYSCHSADPSSSSAHCPLFPVLLGIRLIDEPPADDRGDHLRRSNLMRINVKNILRNDNQVGEFSCLQRAFRFLA